MYHHFQPWLSATICKCVQPSPMAMRSHHLPSGIAIFNHVQPGATLFISDHLQPCATRRDHVRIYTIICSPLQPCAAFCSHMQPCAYMWRALIPNTISANTKIDFAMPIASSEMMFRKRALHIYVHICAYIYIYTHVWQAVSLKIIYNIFALLH